MNDKLSVRRSSAALDAISNTFKYETVSVTDVPTVQLEVGPREIDVFDSVGVAESASAELPLPLELSVFDLVTSVESVTVELPDALKVMVYDYIQVNVYGTTDFSEYATGSWPDGWTEEWDTPSKSTVYFEVLATGDYGGQKLVSKDPGAQNRYGISKDSAGNVKNIEVVYRFQSDVTTGLRGMSIVRGSGGATTETGYVVYLSGQYLRIGYFDGGTFYGDQANTAFAHSADTWYWMRVRVKGWKIDAKIWSGDYDTEPGSFMLNWTDTGKISSRGWIGLENDGDGTDDYDWFSYGNVADGPGEEPPAPMIEVLPSVFDSVTVSDSVNATLVHNISVFEGITVVDIETVQVSGIELNVSVFDPI